MNPLFVGYVETQHAKQRVFTRRPHQLYDVRGSIRKGLNAVNAALASLKRAFSLPEPDLTACQLSPTECFSTL